VNVQQRVTSQSVISGGGVTDEVETFLVDGVVEPGHPGVPAGMTLISSATLQTIRDQMAASVSRIKQLENENKALSMLEVHSPLFTLLFLLLLIVFILHKFVSRNATVKWCCNANALNRLLGVEQISFQFVSEYSR